MERDFYFIFFEYTSFTISNYAEHPRHSLQTTYPEVPTCFEGAELSGERSSARLIARRWGGVF